jgi:hypothetical protein
MKLIYYRSQVNVETPPGLPRTPGRPLKECRPSGKEVPSDEMAPEDVKGDKRVNNLEDYLRLVECGQPLSFVFRGVTDVVKHQLIPSVGRDWKEGTFPLLDLERELLSEFKLRSLPWLSQFRPVQDWDWLMLAQHHGVPTRLLDWTTNPLVALFFACRGDEKVNGAVYVARKESLHRLETDIRHSDVPKVEEDYYIVPPHISARIPAQAACFTVSKEPAKPFACHHRLCRVVVEAAVKSSLLQRVARCGMTEAALFPGLDGLGRELKQRADQKKLDYAMPR